MRKALLLTIFLLSGIWSEAQAAATLYGPTQLGGGANDLRGGTTSEFGMERRTYKVGMTSNGVPLIMARRRTTQYYDLFWTGNGGTTWSTMTNVFQSQSGNGSHNEGMYCFGDSAYLTSSTGTTTDTSLRIVLIRGDTIKSITDTVMRGTEMRNSGAMACAMPLGSTRIFGITRIENATADSLVVFQSNAAFALNGTYTRIEKSTTIPGYGLAVPLTWSGGTKGGALQFDQTAQDLFWYDSATGINSALHTSFLNYTGNAYDKFYIVAMKDSMFATIWQNSVTGGSDSLRVKRCYVTGTAGGSPALTNIDSFVIETEAPIRDGASANPLLSYLNGTDTLFAFYKFWPDTSIDCSYDIGLKIFNGTSWGSRSTFYDMTGEDTLAFLHAPPRIYNIAGNIRHFVTYTDSTNTRDSLHLLMDVLNVGSGTTNVRNSIKKATLKKVSAIFDSPDIWRPEHEVF